MEGVPKILEILGILYWFGSKVIENKKNLKQSCKYLFVMAELPIVWLIVGSDNIFQHRSWCGICNYCDCVQLATTKNQNKIKILDLCFLREHLLIDAKERWYMYLNQGIATIFHTIANIAVAQPCHVCLWFAIKVGHTPNGRSTRKDWFSSLCVMI